LDGVAYTHRLKIGGTGSFDTDGKPVSRVIAFEVSGNTTITVAAMSSSSSADRELVIAAGSKTNELGRFPALGASLTKGTYNYTGGPTTIYIWSPSSGVNLYYLKAETTGKSKVKVGYFTIDKTQGAGAGPDPVYTMLSKDPNLAVTLVAGTTAVSDVSMYDMVVLSEAPSSSAAVVASLKGCTKPILFMKTFGFSRTLANYPATNWGAAADAFVTKLKVNEAQKTHPVFTGITIPASNQINIFKTWANDDGTQADQAANRMKGLSFVHTLTNATGDIKNLGVADTSLVTQADASSILDVPAGSKLNNQDIPARMIVLGYNYGAQTYNNSNNMTAEGFTIVRNSVYLLAGLEIPATKFENVAKLDTLYASKGMLNPKYALAKKAYQLNLPAGTTSVELNAVASEGCSVVLPTITGLSDGQNTTAEVKVFSPLGNDSTILTIDIHVATANEILFVGGDNDGVLSVAMQQDKETVALLTQAGYSVTFLYKWGVTRSYNNNQPFDFTPYKAVIFGASAPSDGTKEYAIQEYPIPCVSLQKDGARYNKWGWVGNVAAQYAEPKPTGTNEEKINAIRMEVTNSDHYITSVFKKGDFLKWTSVDETTSGFNNINMPGYLMADSVTTAIPLAKFAGVADKFNLIAVPKGANVRTLMADNATYARKETKSNIVLLAINTEAARLYTETFSTLLLRSLDWAMDKAPKSSDATLKELTLSAGTLTPAFSPSVTAYSVNLSTGATTVNITAVANDSKATVVGAGAKTFTASGTTANIVVTAEDGTSKTYTVTITVGVGAKDLSQAGIKVYPNPTNQHINIEGLERGTKVMLFNAAGQQVYSEQSSGRNMNIQLSGYNSGIYMIRIEHEGKVFTSKIIKQ
jgi:hypothetical protein